MKRFSFSNFKIIPAWLLLAGMVFGFSGNAASFGTPVALVIDGQSVISSQPAILQNGRVMVPLRTIFQHLGATVNYNSMTRSITATRGNTEIDLALGSNMATVNGNPQSLDAPAAMMNGRILVPLRFVSEALGADVSWLDSTRTVSISSRTGGPTTALNPSAVPSIPLTPERLISRVSAFPPIAIPGQTVTVTMMGAPGGNAAMTLGTGEKINMQEVSSGQYVGKYTVPADLAQAAMDVTVNLDLSGGRTDSMTAGNAFSIQKKASDSMNNAVPALLPGGILPMEVISPNPAATVSPLFDVTGKTLPGAVVRVRLLANKNDEVYNSSGVADSQGNFHFPIDSSNLHHNTHLILYLSSENASGQTSKEIRMELTRQ